MRSKFMSLNWKDFFKGLMIFILSAVITYIYSAIQAGDFWNAKTLKQAGLVALSSFLSYMIKNLFTNSDDEILAPEK